jgi:uncharacterized protein YndB with AHSA1/START domain
MNAAEPTCLVIADITGYTRYLAGVELEHAQDILADLMGTVVNALRPMFRIAKLEGDAAFAYVPAEKVDGSDLQDAVEATYFAFRRRLRDVKMASRCECNACILMPSLDLKLIVHHGEVLHHRVAGFEELVGAAVIVVHRLLKNSVSEALGLTAYALYTQACIDAAGIDPVAQGLVRHVESTDVAGDVVAWAGDLAAAWAADESGRRFRVTERTAYRTYVHESPAPAMLVWEYLTSPVRRPQWSAGITGIDEISPTGRRGVGTVNHCMHGQDVTIEETLDWHPGETWTTRSTMPMPGAPKLLLTWDLGPRPDGGTRLTIRVGKPKPKDRAAFDAMYLGLEAVMLAAAEGFEKAMTAELELRAAAPPEPEVVAGAGRYASEPI